MSKQIKFKRVSAQNKRFYSLGLIVLFFGLICFPSLQAKSFEKPQIDRSNFQLLIGTMVEADYAYYRDDVTELKSGSELRRARLILGGTVSGWNYKMQTDFSHPSGLVLIEDFYVSNKGWTIGAFRQPFSLEDMTSESDLTFMERALPNIFTPFYRIGAAYKVAWSNGSLALALTGEPYWVNAFGDEGIGGGGRFTLAPIHEGKTILHVGSSYAWRQPPDSNSPYHRISHRPESHVDGRRFVDTGTIVDVKSISTYGFEFAAVWNEFSMQGEFISTNIKASSEYSFDGAYIWFNWFITGESRPYERKTGTFTRLRPRAAIGAWSLALRYSYIDLSDNDSVGSGNGIFGGIEQNSSVGLSYFPNPNIRFMLEYVYMDMDNNAIQGPQYPSVIQARMHFAI
ncbi:MAG: porin [Gammaproteobacteria bacterium]|nr:porin [Gammaproteobacteria bacterium]